MAYFTLSKYGVNIRGKNVHQRGRARRPLLKNTLPSRIRQAEKNGSRFSASSGIVPHLQMVDGPVSLCLTPMHARTHTLMHGLLLEFQVSTSCSWLKPLFTGPPNVVWHMLPSWGLSISARMENSGAQQKSLLHGEVFFISYAKIMSQSNPWSGLWGIEVLCFLTHPYAFTPWNQSCLKTAWADYIMCESATFCLIIHTYSLGKTQTIHTWKGSAKAEEDFFIECHLLWWMCCGATVEGVTAQHR